MTHLSDILDTNLLEKMIDEGFVNVQTHNEYPLRIFNYTPAAMYGAKWNSVTTQCRGLIVDEDDNIVAGSSQ